jgi:hypothetical protein
MILDNKGNILDSRNRKQRRLHLHMHHNVFTKKYPSERSRIRSINWLKEIQA